MRKILSLVAVLALSACGGGGGGSAPQPQPPPPPTTAPTSTPQTGLITPQFYIVLPDRTSSGHNRVPQRVSSGANSVTITRTTQLTATPTVVTTDLAAQGHPCVVATPCIVNGPPSPPGVANTFNVNTFGSHDGSGTALDFGTKTYTPIVGTNNVVTLTLAGIPNIVVITALPTNFNAGTGSSSAQTQLMTIDVQDAATKSIAGPYVNNVVITDPDAETYGTSLTGAPCAASVCTLTSSTDAGAVTFNYKGVAENPVTISSSGTGLSSAGTAIFTPMLQAIMWAAGPSSLYTGNSPVTAPVNQGCGPGVTTACGLDFYALSGTGSTGTESYTEAGYTSTPYNKTLTTIDGTSCSAFLGATGVVASDNTGANGGRTDFTATATVASAGVCLRVVSDGLLASGHGSGGPGFVVTFTTSQLSGSSKHRQQ